MNMKTVRILIVLSLSSPYLLPSSFRLLSSSEGPRLRDLTFTRGGDLYGAGDALYKINPQDGTILSCLDLPVQVRREDEDEVCACVCRRRGVIESCAGERGVGI